MDRTARVTYRGILAVPEFRLILSASTVTIVSETLRAIALSFLVLAVTGSTFLSALAYGVSFAPQVAGSALFGTLADRFQPARLIGLGYAIEGVTAVVLGLAGLPCWAALVLVAVVATGTPVCYGAVSRAVSEVLTGESYVLGRSLLNMTSSGGQLLGLVGGGAAIGLAGPRHAMLISAGLYLVAGAWVSLRLRLLPLPAAAPSPGGRVGRLALRAGWTGNRRLLADSSVRLLLLARWLPPAFAVGAESLLIPYTRARGWSAGTSGLLLACLPLGMLAGNLVLGRFVPAGWRQRLIVPLMTVLGLPFLLLLAPDPPVWACVPGLLVTGTGFAYSVGLQQAFLDLVPDRIRGQAFGLQNTGLMTVQGISPALAGALGEVMPIGWAAAVMGTAIVVAAVMFLPRLPALADGRRAAAPAASPVVIAG